ncbi:MAG: hypothetical protein ACE145_16560 [Terriglobia bacterium]
MRLRSSHLRLAILALAGMCVVSAPTVVAKDKTPPLDPNDPTLRLFQLLDSTRGGKLAGFFVVADVYKDPGSPDEELQHILRAEYDKDRGFARLSLYVRSVGKIGPEQMKTYTAKEFYEFGIADQEKFMKTDPGPFGVAGDTYLHAEGDRPLISAPVTDEVRKTYELFVAQHLLPALQKK